MKKSLPSLFLLFLLVFPFFLRRKWRVTGQINIPAKPPEIFPYLNDLRNWPLWTEWATPDKIEYSYGALTAGTGAEQTRETRKMKAIIRITQSVLDSRVAYTVAMEQGTIEGAIGLEETEAGARVTWFYKWESGPNPYGRYLDAYHRLLLKRDIKAGLENLRHLIINLHQA